jgi:uncharacterized protein YjbI with pentapeptide repeats
MEIWFFLLVIVIISLLGVIVVLPILYTRGYMQQLPLWTGLHYSQDFKPSLKGFGLKGYEKVQIVEENPESQTKKQTITYELQSGKTLWDWVQLLFIPVMLAFVAFAFNVSQASTNQQLQQQSKQEQVVDTYLNQMSNLLLQNHLHDSQPGDPIRAIAQATTLTALDRLDGEHKNIIILFLYRADILKYHYYKHNETECGDPKVLKKQFPDENPIITLSQGNIDGVTINDLKLSCIDLHNMDLERSNFSTSLLDRADLGLSLATNADFSYASMKSANLYYLDLSDANLQGALLQYANMRGVCLSHARLDGANLQHADLRVYTHSVNYAALFCGQHDNSTLTPANLSDADLIGTKLIQADFTQANLTDADLVGADLTAADLRGADLSGANLFKTVLRGTRYNAKEILVKDSQRKILVKVLPTKWPRGFNPKAAGATEINTLSGANLSGADLSGAYMYNADLSGTNLSGANLKGANLRGAYMINADLSGTNLSDANLNDASLWRVDLSGINLSGANLNSATLWGADLSGTNLSGANLYGASLWRVDLSGANLSNAKITQAQLNEAASLKGAIMPDGKKHT